MMQSKRRLILSFILLGALATGCSHGSGSFDDHDDYEHLVENHTQAAYSYKGVNNVYEMRATILTTELINYQIAMQGHAFQWDEGRASEEKLKAQQQSSNQTKVFLNFYTPDTSQDDLLSTTSIWRIFLDVDGKRYIGTIEKSKVPFAELQNLFPYHNRWSTPYYITFAVALPNVELSGARLTITGPVGSEQMAFAKRN